MTVNTTLAVLEYIRLHNHSTTLLYPSSTAVYGDKEDYPIAEDELLTPVSPYGYHKAIVESLCKNYSSNYNLKIAIIRFFSLYGEGLTKQLLWDSCNKLISSDKNVEFYGTGSETRDFIHIKDATSLIYAILTGSTSNFDIYNGGSGCKSTIKDIINMLAKELNTSKAITFNGNQKIGDPKHYHADITKSLLLSWKPTINLKDGIKQYINSFASSVDKKVKLPFSSLDSLNCALTKASSVVNTFKFPIKSFLTKKALFPLELEPTRLYPLF
jgi:UDP-glucose 4-epimerase